MAHNLNNFFLTGIFSRILEMTVIASIVILMVIAVRFAIRKAPKVFSYMLWSVVLFRLLCPISFSTNMSLFNLKLFNIPIVCEVQNVTARSENTSTIYKVNIDKVDAVNDIPYVKDATSTTEKITDNSKRINSISIATTVWVAGMLLMLTINLASFLKIKRKTAACLKIRDNIYISDEIDTPFCLGLIRPKIYLPSNLQEKEMEYIIIHEQTHIRRKDHIIKFLAFVALMIHWFNPFVWVAFILACKDIEMSCDETVIRKMKNDIRQDYCLSILQLATRRRFSLVAPLSFADGDPKRRIKNVMYYKKPKRGIIVLTMIICIAAALGLSSNAKNKTAIDVIAEASVLNSETDVTTTSTSIENAVNLIEDDDNVSLEEATDDSADNDSLVELTDENTINEYIHGFTIPTDMNISNVEYYLSNDTLEIHFMYENHTLLVARVAEANSYKDISEVYYPWTFETDELTILGRPTHTRSYFSDTESVMLITWFEADMGVNVSLEATGKDLDGFDIFAVAERMLPKK